ncbi:MAG: dUTP diphosphatase [Halanaerobiaceae bacterium]
MKVKIKRIDKSLPLPEYQHYGEDVGLDLYSRESNQIQPKKFKLIKSGIKIEIPRGYGGFIYPRSGLALNKGVTVLNADGVIDPGYRGEVGIILINHGEEVFNIKKGDRIAQLLIHKVFEVEWDEVESLENTSRGSGGFGNTGR